MKGTIKSWGSKKDPTAPYFFVRPDDGGEDVFCRAALIASDEKGLAGIGSEVDFELAKPQEGKGPTAKAVKILTQGTKPQTQPTPTQSTAPRAPATAATPAAAPAPPKRFAQDALQVSFDCLLLESTLLQVRIKTGWVDIRLGLRAQRKDRTDWEEIGEASTDDYTIATFFVKLSAKEDVLLLQAAIFLFGEDGALAGEKVYNTAWLRPGGKQSAAVLRAGPPPNLEKLLQSHSYDTPEGVMNLRCITRASKEPRAPLAPATITFKSQSGNAFRLRAAGKQWISSVNGEVDLDSAGDMTVRFQWVDEIAGDQLIVEVKNHPEESHSVYVSGNFRALPSWDEPGTTADAAASGSGPAVN